MVRAEYPAAALQRVRTQGAGRLRLGHHKQCDGKGNGRRQGDRVVRAEHLAAALKCVLTQGEGWLRLPQDVKGLHQDSGRNQRGRVVRAERPAAAPQGVLTQVASGLRLSQFIQDKAQPTRGGQRVGMVEAEDGPPTAKHLLADGLAARDVAVGPQIVGGVQDQLPAGGRGVDQRAGGEHVRSQLGIAGPAGRIIRVAGGTGGQQRHRSVGDGMLPVERKLMADDRLHQPVHLEAVGVAAGQRVADQRAEGVGEGVGVGGGGAQRLAEQVGVVVDQRQRNGFGREEGGQFQQLHRGRVGAAETVQRQRPGGVNPPGVAHHLAAGEQVGSAGAEPAQIVGGWEVGLLQIGGGLRGGQRQVAELGGELVGQILAHGRNPGPQQGHRLRPGQHVDLQPPAQCSPAGSAGGDQHVAGPAGPVVGDVLRTVGVVEDQQPAVSATQLAHQPLHGGGDRRLRPAGPAGRRARRAGRR